MSDIHIFDFLPLWASFICIMTIILFSTWGGVVFVRSRGKSDKNDDDSHLGTVVAATLALIAFILALTFNLTLERFDARKHYLNKEVNCIETTWLRAGLISEPYSSEVKDLLLEFLKLRVETAKHPEKIPEFLGQANIIERKLWSIVTNLTNNAPRNDAINALFVESVNEMYDTQTSRVIVTLVNRIPSLIWITFFFLMMITMFAVGYLYGKQEKTDWYMILALSLAFSLVILIIVDLDRTAGIIQINYLPITDLYQRLLNG